MDPGPPISPVAVVPTYNNGFAVLAVLQRIASLGLPILVINDGSTDDTPDQLQRWLDGGPSTPARVVTHDRNRGKAAALRTGFRAAAQAGHTHAVTIDSDGQHEPEDIPALLQAAAMDPHALVLGVREADLKNYPLGSRVGRKLSNLAIFLECGVRITDSQCGLRVYPVRLTERVKCHAGRFGYETEVITRAGWAGCEVVQVPITCRYKPRGQHTSHFRTGMDSWLGVKLHARLLGRALLPVPHERWMDDPPLEPTAQERRTLPRRFWHWINPMHAWRQVFDANVSRGELASGLALGVFVANLPIFPLQSALALYLAHRLHLHPAVVFAGSSASTPPVGLVLIAAAIGVGHLLLTGEPPVLADYDPRHIEPMKVAGQTLLEWVVGSPIVGLVTGLLTFAATYLVVGWARHRRAK